jgi:outer membrane receptor protein involved in Fe transport
MDGVPISDPYTGAVNSSMVLSGAMGTVSVTKGPAASVYGANALGGIVEVTTAGTGDRSGLGYLLSTDTNGHYSGHVSGGGSVGAVHLSGGLAANGDEGFGLPRSYEGEQWEDGGTRDYSGREDVFAWGRAAWDVTSDARASVSLQFADGKWDAPASTSSSRPRFWSFPFWRETRAIGSLGWTPNDDLFVEGKFFYATNHNKLASYADFDRTERRWLSTVSNRVFGGYVFSELTSFDSHRISGGLNVKRDLASQQSDVGEEWEDYEATTASLFGQDVVVLGRDDLVAFAVNADAMAGEDVSLFRLNPQASWTHRLPAGFSVRTLAGLKTRFPTLKEWFSPSIGNPDLRPEHSTSVEAELGKRFGGSSRVSALVYKQWVKDMIVSAGGGDPCRNVGSATSWGAEIGAAHRLTSELELDISLALTNARDDETDELVELVPRTMIMASASYEKGLFSSVARIRQVGSRPMNGEDPLPPYVLMDARGALKTAWGDLFAGVENIFDVLYEDEVGFPQAGRSFEFGIMRELYR